MKIASELSYMDKSRFFMAVEGFSQQPVMHLNYAFKTTLREEANLNRARFSGTSMATPNSLQAMSRFIVAKAKKQGLALNDLYGREGFRRDDILKELDKFTNPLSKNTYLIPLDYVYDTHEYRPNKAELAYRKKLDDILGKEKKSRPKKNAAKSCLTIF